jgi:amino acid transporter
LVNAVFAFLGTELIGVTVGEAQNPRKTIPRAIKLTFYRIVFFYVLAVLFLGMLVPYDDPRLFKPTNRLLRPPRHLSFLPSGSQASSICQAY